jgi:hypothetical protein
MPRLLRPTAAIDPGQNRAVAVDSFPTPKVFPCPQDEASLLDLLRRENVGKVVVENVGQARAGNGLVSAVKLRPSLPTHPVNPPDSGLRDRSHRPEQMDSGFSWSR